MYVQRLHIRNYRCFDDNPTIAEFSESGLAALIGPNNVGKSTVLKMLEILLGDKWPSSQFNEDDFYNNELTKDIVIVCEFVQSFEIRVSNNIISVAGVAVRAKHLSTGYGESSIDVEYRLLESLNNIEQLNFENLDVATYRYPNGTRGDRPIFVNQEIRNQLPIVITIPLIKLHSEQPVNKWGVLGRMLQKVERLFTTDEARESKFKEKMKDAVGVLREPDEFQSIEADIKDFWEKMKPVNLSGTNLEFLDFEPWRYYRQFKLAVKRRGREVPIETLGEGIQRLAVIALYRTYLKRHGRKEKAILLVEEPESYLHPQARGTLFHVLKKAIKEEANVEGQIIYTTHSEDFIDCGDFDDIIIFSEKQNGVEIRHITEEILKNHTLALGYVRDVDDQHIYYRSIETDTKGLKEALFAHKAIIVEGASEVELLRFFTEAEKDQVAIVSAGSKSSIPSIYSFLTAFGIPSLVMIDRDDKNSGDNQKIVSILTQSSAQRSDSTKIDLTEEDIKAVKDGTIYTKERLLVFGKNLEKVFETTLNDYNKLISKIREIFNLPKPPNESKPREIQAIGLAYRGNCNGDQDLKSILDNEKEKLDNIAKILDDFIKQEVKKPDTLEVANSVS